MWTTDFILLLSFHVLSIPTHGISLQPVVQARFLKHKCLPGGQLHQVPSRQQIYHLSCNGANPQVFECHILIYTHWGLSFENTPWTPWSRWPAPKVAVLPEPLPQWQLGKLTPSLKSYNTSLLLLPCCQFQETDTENLLLNKISRFWKLVQVSSIRMEVLGKSETRFDKTNRP